MSWETNTPPSISGLEQQMNQRKQNSLRVDSSSKWDSDEMKEHNVETLSLATNILESYRRKRPHGAFYPYPELAEKKKRAGETCSPQQKTKLRTVFNVEDDSYQQEPKAEFGLDAVVPKAAGDIAANSVKSANLEGMKDIVRKDRYSSNDDEDNVKDYEKDCNAAVVSKVDMPVNYNMIDWFAQLEELKKYKQLNGDCMVPHHYLKNPRLGSWVS
jgi:hypothetical protein